MKVKYLILIFVSLLLIALIYFIVYRKKVEITNIKHFHLSYTKGYMINSNIIYELDYENNKYYAIIKPYGISDEDKLKVVVSSDIKKQIMDILKKYEVEKWDGFNKSDHGVLDGDSFSLSVTMENGNDIHASGYMRWPNNYRNVVDEIDKIFMEIYNSNK